MSIEKQETFPWEFVKKITFVKPDKTILEFRSGNSLEAQAPSQDVYDNFIKEAYLNLDLYRIEFI